MKKPTPLSKAALAHIAENITCPDCKKGQLLDGPRALGINVNVKCAFAGCGHEFNLTIWHEQVVSGERIDRDEPGLYREPLTALR